MKNTILTQIIKKVILTEQGGFTELPDSTPVSLNTQKKTGNKTVINKVIKKVDPKKPLKGTAIPDQVLKNGPYRNPHFIYSKTADGVWRFEYYDKATKTLKSGIVTNPQTLNQLTAGNHEDWTGKYGEQQEKLSKKEWLNLMDQHDPMFPKKSLDPAFSSEVSSALAMALYYGGIAIGAAAGVWLTAKLGLYTVQKAGQRWATGAGTLKVKSLTGVTTEEAEELSRQAKTAYIRREISYREMTQLQKAFNNPMLRLPGKRAVFNAAYDMMVRGDMTMSEFIQYMPSVYRDNEKLKRLLLEYEAQLNAASPQRRAKWAESAAKYAKKNANFKRDLYLDDLFDKMGISKNNPIRKAMDATNTGKLSALQALDVTYAQKVKTISKGVDDSVAAVRSDVTWHHKNDFFTMGSYDPNEVYTNLMNITPMKTTRWGLSLSSGNIPLIPRLLATLARSKDKKAAIETIKNFAVTNNWDYTRNKEIIDEFMLHVLKNFYSKK